MFADQTSRHSGIESIEVAPRGARELWGERQPIRPGIVMTGSVIGGNGNSGS